MLDHSLQAYADVCGTYLMYGISNIKLHEKPSCVKVLVVIRHGESEYNAAARQADQWADPKLYDPSLTARGCQQSRQLRNRLAAEMKSNQGVLSGHTSTVWVTSPLRRCIQTFLLSCPLLPETPADRVGSKESKVAVVQQVQEKLDVLATQELPPVRIVRCLLLVPSVVLHACIIFASCSWLEGSHESALNLQAPVR